MHQTTFPSLSEKIHDHFTKIDLESTDFTQYIASQHELTDLSSILQYSFQNRELLVRALSHPSFRHEFPEVLDYQNLEFLGDATLGLLIADKILGQYPTFSEGKLSRLRGSLVNEGALASLARALDLGRYIIVGKGETISKGYEKEAILADSVESILGAVFLDGGFNAARSVLDSVLKTYQDKTGSSFIDLKKLEEFDSKSKLQEKTVALLNCIPEYQFENSPLGFKAMVLIEGKIIGTAEGTSKKRAEKAAAKKILKNKIIEKILGDKNVN